MEAIKFSLAKQKQAFQISRCTICALLAANCLRYTVNSKKQTWGCLLLKIRIGKNSLRHYLIFSIKRLIEKQNTNILRFCLDCVGHMARLASFRL